MEEADAAIHGDVRMKCTFCGATETLPAEPSERVRAVRQRLQQIAWARQNAEAPAIGIAQAVEQWKWAMAMMLPLVLFGMLYRAAYTWSSEAALQIGASSFIQLAVLVSVSLGAALGMRGYVREVRPELLAFAPSEPGAPPRCRCCGGELPASPSVRGAFVTCTYCQAPNLLTGALATRRETDLQREVEAHRRRAQGVTDRMAVARERMLRASYVGMGVGFALSWVGYAILGALG